MRVREEENKRMKARGGDFRGVGGDGGERERAIFIVCGNLSN